LSTAVLFTRKVVDSGVGYYNKFNNEVAYEETSGLFLSFFINLALHSL